MKNVRKIRLEMADQILKGNGEWGRGIGKAPTQQQAECCARLLQARAGTVEATGLDKVSPYNKLVADMIRCLRNDLELFSNTLEI